MGTEWITWTLVAAALALLAILYGSEKKKYRNLPPGPKSWPLVGTLFSIGRSRHRSLAQLAAKYGGIMYMELGSRPHVIISTAAMAKEVLKEHDLEFANRPQYSTFFKHVSHNFNDLVFAPHGERWKMLRRICGMELFTTSKINLFSKIRKRELAAFASIIEASAKEGRAFDLTTLLHELFTNLMTCVLFGRKFYSSDHIPLTPQAEEYRQVWEALISESEKFYIGDYVPALKWIDKVNFKDYKLKKVYLPAVEHFLRSIIEEHKKDYQPEATPRDFVDVMLSLNGEDRLDNESIIALLQNLLLAGTNTSKGTLEWGMSELIRNPKVMQKAQEEIDNVVGTERYLEESDLKNLPYLQAVVKEIMRVHPIATMGLPHCNSDKQGSLGGYTIPPHTTVLINIWAIHHDPSTWEEPDRFYPERFLNTDHNVLGQHFDLIPFSSGRRRCVGMPLALPHITLTLAYLLHRFDWKPQPGTSPDEVDLAETTGLVTIPAKHRIVCASVRHSYNAKE